MATDLPYMVPEKKLKTADPFDPTAVDMWRQAAVDASKFAGGMFAPSQNSPGAYLVAAGRAIPGDESVVGSRPYGQRFNEELKRYNAEAAPAPSPEEYAVMFSGALKPTTRAQDLAVARNAFGRQAASRARAMERGTIANAANEELKLNGRVRNVADLFDEKGPQVEEAKYRESLPGNPDVIHPESLPPDARAVYTEDLASWMQSQIPDRGRQSILEAVRNNRMERSIVKDAASGSIPANRSLKSSIEKGLSADDARRLLERQLAAETYVQSAPPPGEVTRVDRAVGLSSGGPMPQNMAPDNLRTWIPLPKFIHRK